MKFLGCPMVKNPPANNRDADIEKRLTDTVRRGGWAGGKERAGGTMERVTGKHIHYHV